MIAYDSTLGCLFSGNNASIIYSACAVFSETMSLLC